MRIYYTCMHIEMICCTYSDSKKQMKKTFCLYGVIYAMGYSPMNLWHTIVIWTAGSRTLVFVWVNSHVFNHQSCNLAYKECHHPNMLCSVGKDLAPGEAAHVGVSGSWHSVQDVNCMCLACVSTVIDERTLECKKMKNNCRVRERLCK
jgi:hypothetical protein